METLIKLSVLIFIWAFTLNQVYFCIREKQYLWATVIVVMGAFILTWMLRG